MSPRSRIQTRASALPSQHTAAVSGVTPSQRRHHRGCRQGCTGKSRRGTFRLDPQPYGESRNLVVGDRYGARQQTSTDSTCMPRFSSDTRIQAMTGLAESEGGGEPGRTRLIGDWRRCKRGDSKLRLRRARLQRLHRALHGPVLDQSLVTKRKELATASMDWQSTGARMKRPRFQRNNVKARRVRMPPPGVDLAEVADSCCYVGSPYHKDRPSFAGMPHSRRPDASIVQVI